MKTAQLKKRRKADIVRDPLTGLITREGFIKAGTAKLRKTARWRRPVTLIYVDLDNFAKFKQEHGEKEANLIVAKLGRDFQHRFRRGDLITHLHGDEFMILLPGVDPENAIEALHRFRAALEDALKECPWPITASIGAVTYLSCPPSVQLMIKTVEPVMQAVKESGKNATKHQVVH